MLIECLSLQQATRSDTDVGRQGQSHDIQKYYELLSMHVVQEGGSDGMHQLQTLRTMSIIADDHGTCYVPSKYQTITYSVWFLS